MRLAVGLLPAKPIASLRSSGNTAGSPTTGRDKIIGKEYAVSDLTIKHIEQSIKDRKRLHLRFLDNVKTYKAFLDLEEKAFADGSLNKKTKELMALSISIVTKCEPCMEWHLDQALQSGATDEEIYETIDVAIEMGGGPAGAYARFVLNALEYFRRKEKSM